MARAQAIDTRLEKLLPALDEYYAVGFLTRAETVEVSRQRTHWEYRLVAKPLLLLDVQGAVAYELGLEKRLRAYCISSRVQLKHRWSILERVEQLYRIGLRNLRQRDDRETLRRECVDFLRRHERHASLSRLYAEWMLQFPTRADVWVEAAEWEGIERRKTDNGRAIIQQALVTMPAETAVWATALKLELAFARRLLDGLIGEEREQRRKAEARAADQLRRQQRVKDKTDGLAGSDAEDDEEEGTGGNSGGKKKTEKKNVAGKKRTRAEQQQQEAGDGEDAGKAAAAAAGPAPGSFVAQLRQENASLAAIALDLALAQAVVEEAFAGPATRRPDLVDALLRTAGDGGFTFARPVAERVLALAADKAAALLADPATPQAVRTPWAAAAVGIVRDALCREHVCASRFRVPLETVDDYIRDQCGVPLDLDDEGGVSDGKDEAAEAERERKRAEALLQRRLELRTRNKALRAAGAGKAAAALLVFLSRVSEAQFASRWGPSSSSSSSMSAADAPQSATRQLMEALREAVTPLAKLSPEAVSSLCVALLRQDPKQSDTECSALLRRLLFPFADESASATNKGTKKQKNNRGDKQEEAEDTDAAVPGKADAGTEALAALAKGINRLQKELSERVEELVPGAGADDTAASAHKRPKTEKAATAKKHKEAAASPMLLQTWPAALLYPLVLPEDRTKELSAVLQAAAAAAASATPNGKTSGGAASSPSVAAAATAGDLSTDSWRGSRASAVPITPEHIDRFLLWWRQQQSSIQSLGSASKAAAAAKQACRAELLTFLRHFGLMPADASGGNGSSGGGNVTRRPPLSAALLKEAAAQGIDSRDDPRLVLLLRRNALVFRDPASTPVTLWRLFSALELMDADVPLGAETSAAAAAKRKKQKKGRSTSTRGGAGGAGGHSDDDSSSSSDDDDDSANGSGSYGYGGQKRDGFLFRSPAEAGLAFLAGVSLGALDTAGEWQRVEGVSNLLRSRLHRLLNTSDFSALQRRRERQRHKARQQTQTGASASAAETEEEEERRRVRLDRLLLSEAAALHAAALRCQPLPRYCQSDVLIPFLEMLARLQSGGGPGTSSASAGPATATATTAAVAKDAVAAARDAHENLIRLYNISAHPESFVPLLYTPSSGGAGGHSFAPAATPARGAASLAAVQLLNAEDWLAYVRFEREVARDLRRAKDVVDRATRFALSPQLFLTKLNSM